MLKTTSNLCDAWHELRLKYGASVDVAMQCNAFVIDLKILKPFEEKSKKSHMFTGHV